MDKYVETIKNTVNCKDISLISNSNNLVYKVITNDDEVLYIYSRSSQGYKYNVCLANSVGVIDSEFYNNPSNEGHFQVRLINLGESDYEVKVGDRIAQGVFMKYLTVDDEEEIKSERTGGLGSTNK